MGTKYDYISTLAMNKKIVVLGADSGVLRVFDRNLRLVPKQPTQNGDVDPGYPFPLNRRRC